MADQQAKQAPVFVDGFTTFPKGINSGEPSLSLPKKQLSFAINCTVRGFYITHRPALRKIEMLFPTTDIQSGVEDGKFQGGAYYKPDSGAESLFAAISGRLFQFTPGSTTPSATVSEQTIPADPNPVDALEAWLWQAENFLIWNDGQSTPVFFDGFSSRRATSAGSDLTITNSNDTPGNTVPAGSPVWGPSGLPGIIFTASQFPYSFPSGLAVGGTITLNTFTAGPVSGSYVYFGVYVFQLVGSTAHTVTIRAIVPIPAGYTVTGNAGGVTALMATTLADYIVPAVGAPVTVPVDSPVFVYPAGNGLLVGNPYAAYTFTSFTYVASAELPAGRMGVYGLGRNWVSLTDGRSFIGSDIVGASSGSAPYQKRDSVLKITENSYLAGGGVFVVPGNVGDIRAMIFTATLDSSLGQGPLQVFTPKIVFSVNAPVDRTVWQAIENPILTQSLISNGGLGQKSTVQSNNDTIFRAIDGIRSLILARREFNTWGNTPISREVTRIIRQDSTALLRYGSAVVFSNRLLMTSKPTPSERGIFHPGLIALNFDPQSNLEGKAPSVYDGLWTGVNGLQWIAEQFNGVPRCFGFGVNNSTNKIELYELPDDETSGIADNNGNSIPITWQFETANLFKDLKGKGEFDPVKLIDGEMYVADVFGRVTFTVEYRSQFDPCWHRWTQFSICATMNTIGARRQNRVSLGFGLPSAPDCDTANNRPSFIGETFQLRITITGHCKVYGILIKASQEPRPFFNPATCGEVECKLIDCPDQDDFTIYSLEDAFSPVNPPNILNQTVYFSHTCPEDQTLTFSGTLPAWVTFDEDNQRLVGVAGTFSGISQEAANATAQAALNEIGNAAIASGDLSCESPGTVCEDGANMALVYEIDGYFDGMIANNSGIATGKPRWDGTFPFVHDGGAGDQAWYSNENISDYTMDGDQDFCLNFINYDCLDDEVTWQIGFGTDTANLWFGEKVGGATPEGVYNRVNGDDLSPATVTLVLAPGTTSPVGSRFCSS